MGRQRNRPQMKEQEDSSEELNKMDPSNLSAKEFKVMIIRMTNSMTKDIDTTKKTLRMQYPNLRIHWKE